MPISTSPLSVLIERENFAMHLLIYRSKQIGNTMCGQCGRRRVVFSYWELAFALSLSFSPHAIHIETFWYSLLPTEFCEFDSEKLVCTLCRNVWLNIYNIQCKFSVHVSSWQIFHHHSVLDFISNERVSKRVEQRFLKVSPDFCFYYTSHICHCNFRFWGRKQSTKTN